MKLNLGTIIVLLFAIFSIEVTAAPSRVDRMMAGRMESNCFFSPMGCIFLPRNYNRVRRVHSPTPQDAFGGF